MAEVTVVFWRDIPAQVIVGKGRQAVKRPLDTRFEQAIDRAAMKAGLAASDDYLAQWRKAAPYRLDGDEAAIAEAEAVRLESDYPMERLRDIAAAGGLDPEAVPQG